MKIKSLIMVAMAALFVSCHVKSDREADMAASTDSIVLPQGVVFVRGEKYKPAEFAETDTIGFPLAMLDDRKYGIHPTLDRVVVDNVGADSTEHGWIYDISILNRSDDSLRIERLWVEDATFDGYIFEGNWTEGLISWIKLRADSALSRENLHIVVKFKENKYPAQTLRVNLHPDVYKLKSRFAAEGLK